MLSPPPTTETPDPHVAAAIARAEVRRAQLERLVVIGMELAEEIRERHVQAPLHPEPRHDPCRGFASVSRAVRLTLAFAARIDADLDAMRKGEPTSMKPLSPGRRRAAPPEGPTFASGSPRALCPEGVRVRDAVESAINAEFAEWDGAMGALDELHERLIDYETRDRFASLPWRECVEAICADMGLEPDWSRWSEETGFIGPIGKPDVKWNTLWSYDPKRADARRRRRAGRPEPAEAVAAATAHPPDPHSRQ
jgi:hypothetical protein